MLDGFVSVMATSELPPGDMKFVVINRQRVLVANVGGVFYALSDICGHAGAPLSAGNLTGYVVECPLHYACFDARTGKLITGPVSADVLSYEVRVEADTVYVKPPPPPEEPPMKAYWISPGATGTSVERRETPTPVPKAGEMLVRVRAAALDRGELRVGPHRGA